MYPHVLGTRIIQLPYIVSRSSWYSIGKTPIVVEQSTARYEAQFNEDGYPIGGKSVVIETVAQRNGRLAIVREAQRKEL